MALVLECKKAYGHGNIVSLMNTAHLAGHNPLPNKQNNVTVIMAGNNFNFYVTIGRVYKDEELFIDYGAKYSSNPIEKP